MVEDFGPGVDAHAVGPFVVLVVLAVVVVEAVAVVVEVGVEAHVEETAGTVGHVEAGAVAPRGAHVVGDGVADDALEEVVVFGIGERANLVGAPATVGLDAHVAEGLEELLPAGLHRVGVAGVETLLVAGAVAVVAIDAEACQVLLAGMAHAHRVVELEVVHALGAVGEVDGGADAVGEERAVVGEGGAVGVELVGGVVEVGVCQLVAEAGAEGEAAPAVGPVDVGVEAPLLAVEMVGAQGVDEGAVVVVIAFVVVVGVLEVGAQAIAQFAVLRVGAVVAGVEIEAVVVVAGHQVALLVRGCGS